MRAKEFHGKLGKDFETAVAWPHYPTLRRTLVKKVVNLKGVALEVGCGPGNLTKLVLDSNLNLKISAVDNEPVMIKKAKENLKSYERQKRVEIVASDALKFLKKSSRETFDMVFSGQTLHNFQKNYRYRVLEEIYRVLKKGVCS